MTKRLPPYLVKPDDVRPAFSFFVPSLQSSSSRNSAACVNCNKNEFHSLIIFRTSNRVVLPYILFYGTCCRQTNNCSERLSGGV